MPEGTDKKKPVAQPDLNIGGSLGALPTENLLQMIGNLRLSTRLLLENSDTKDFCILTFKEGELVPEIESSHYPPLNKVLDDIPSIPGGQLAELAEAQSDLPFWNRVLVAGLADRDILKRYLVDGIRFTLSLFRSLAGVHFELSPLPMKKLGTSEGYSVTEICALSRKPEGVPEPQPRAPEQEKPRAEPEIRKKEKPQAPPQADCEPFKQALTDLMRQLKDVLPGALACYVMDCLAGKSLASSSTLMFDDRPDYHVITDMLCSRTHIDETHSLKTNELYLLTEDYLLGVCFITPTRCVLAICKRNTQLGLLLTGLRKAKAKVVKILGQPRS